jgi:leucyl aminopeptidase
MPTAQITTPIALTSDPVSSVGADLVIVPWFEGDVPAAVTGLDAATGGEIARALSSKELQSKPYEMFAAGVIDRAWRPRRVVLIGGGVAEAGGPEQLRRLAAAGGLAARQKRVERVALIVRGAGDPAELVQAAAEGLTLSEFDAGSYKTGEPPLPVPSWTLVVERSADDRIAAAINRGRILGDCSNLSRQLANEPGNTLTPREFARRAAAIASEGGVRVEILDETKIGELGMGLLLGKGITFDTGGISIKPADGMERMKDDMAGGAAVACAMRAIGLLQAPVRVIGVVPTTENMPGGRAIKPGDILKSGEGKTVEVINTDAEGRLILGDGLWYARQLGATHLVDVATLTGAVVVALGKNTTGLFGTPDDWVERVRRVANRAGDRAWPLPLFDDYREQLKSDIADMTNTGGRPAGSITAAMFLKEFTGGLPWAHLDIAGTAWAEEAKPFLPKGPSGVAVRTLAELAFAMKQAHG